MRLWKSWTTLAGVIVIMWMLSVGMFAAIPGKQKPNTFGAVTYQTNPYMYEAVNEVAEVSNVEGNLNLRIKHVGTYMLYDENILICGLPIDKFQGIGSPFLMTLERVSHRAVGGVGCHELIRVNEIVPTKGLQ
jgi:hypothetical protein